jgi:hypothetical protein
MTLFGSVAFPGLRRASALSTEDAEGYRWPRHRGTLCFRDLDYRCADRKGVSVSSLKSVNRLSRPTSS